MFSLLFLAGLSFLLCFFFTPLIRNFLNRVGILDSPDGARKVHPQPIPRLGGVPILAAMALSLAVFALVPFSGAAAFRQQWPTLLRLVPADASEDRIAEELMRLSQQAWEKAPAAFQEALAA